MQNLPLSINLVSKKKKKQLVNTNYCHSLFFWNNDFEWLICWKIVRKFAYYDWFMEKPFDWLSWLVSLFVNVVLFVVWFRIFLKISLQCNCFHTYSLLGCICSFYLSSVVNTKTVLHFLRVNGSSCDIGQWNLLYRGKCVVINCIITFMVETTVETLHRSGDI